MSYKESIRTPGIAYTASRLGEYAREQGIDTDTPFNPSTTTINQGCGPGARSFRQGWAIPPGFEVPASVPSSIPVVLARLALFDCRLRQAPHPWTEDMDKKFGVHPGSVRWLRLVQTEPDDERVRDILSIVGANHKNGIKGVETDERGNEVPYTRHYYMESDKYAVKVAQLAPERHLGVPVTGIEFILPSTAK